MKLVLPLLLLLVGCKFKRAESLPNMLGQTEAVTYELDIPPATVDVAVFVAPSESSTSSRCTGVVVSDDLVLTAAHCIADPDKGLREPALVKVLAQALGRPGLAKNKSVDVVQWKKHPSFTRLGSPDIALLRVKESLEPFGKPVALAPANALSVLSRLLVAGYGATETNESGGKLLAGWAEIQSMDSQSEFTIRRPKDGASPYYGDSGGPAYVSRQGLWFAAGLVSRGNASGRVIYTDLSSPEMAKWIADTARELRAQPPVVAGLAGMGSRSVMGATPASTVVSPAAESSPVSNPAACGGCRVPELDACIQSGRKDCYPSLGCVDFSQACNASALRICLDNGGGNACYTKWRCARDCSASAR